MNPVAPVRVALVAAALASLAGARPAAAERAALVLGGELDRQERTLVWRAAAQAIQAAGWTVVDPKLPADQVATLLDCVRRDISDDKGCVDDLFARTGVDRAVIVGVQNALDQGKPTLDQGKPILDQDRPTRRFDGWIFRPSGTSLQVGQEFCHACRSDRLETSARTLVTKLIRGARARARPSSLTVESIPPGAQIRVDDKMMGVTDLDFQVYPGRHIVELAKDGFQSATREVTVEDGESVAVGITLTPHSEKRSSTRVLPWLVLGAGGAALVAGGVLLALDQDHSSTADRVRDKTIRQTTWYGVGVGAAGAVAVGVGLYLVLRPGETTAPAPLVWLGQGATGLGVTGAF